jgi:hypothetical protein
MTVQFYKYIGNPKKIHKTFSATYESKTINPTDVYDDQQPILILSYDSTIYNNANYCVIGSDCYFIPNRALETGQRMVLNLDKDLLMTNRAEIEQTRIIVERSTTMIDSWMPDTLEAHTVQKITQNYLIGNLRSSLVGSCKVILAAVGSRDVI